MKNSMGNKIFAFIFFFIFCMCNSKKDLDDASVFSDKPYSSDSNDSTDDGDDLVDEAKNKLSIFLCTANVHEFFEIDKLGIADKNRLTILIEHISEKTNLKDSDVVVLCLQEDTNNSCKDISKKFMQDNGFKKFSRFEAKTGESNFTNTIVVLSKRSYTCKNVVEKIDSGSGVTPRCVNILNIELGDGMGKTKTLCIANTHLFGGRYDDLRISETTKNERDTMMQKVLGHSPQLILGDFNADATGNEKRVNGNYWKKIFDKRNFTDPDKQKKFLDSPHGMLHTSNYESVYDYLLNGINSTTPFEIISDWIYVQKKPSVDFTVKGSGVVKACEANGAGNVVSDHDFVFCDLEFTI